MRIINDLQRIIKKDISVWIKDSEIENRIDWIDLDSFKVFENIQRVLESMDDYDNVILLGMGGSSLAPLVFCTIYQTQKRIFVLDTINPDQITYVENQIQGKRNVFIVSSKSGTTLETKVLQEYFEKKYPNSCFIAITDQGTVLDSQARQKGWIVFNPNPNIGGRYSAFTEFGLVPAYLAKVDIEPILYQLKDIKQNLLDFIDAKFPEFYALQDIDRDFYYILFEYDDVDYVIGLWLEQLIAESTGKNSKGVLPVIFNPSSYSMNIANVLGKFKLSLFKSELAKWMYVWFMYTSLLCSYLKVNPFNQPDVQLSKDITNKLINSEDDIRIDDFYVVVDSIDDLYNVDLGAYLGDSTKSYDYVALQVFSSYDYFDSFERLRYIIADRLKNVVVWGFGPRYLHSIGQLYKGGYGKPLFIQIIVEPKQKIENINRYFILQAMGDLITTRNLGKQMVSIYVKA
ncbi:MAG: hypothetical protein ABDH21_04005 [bacterium]